jgi:mce4 protein
MMNLSKEVKAGLIAIFAIVSFMLFFQFLKGKNVFSTDNFFFVKYDNVDGLEPSNAVTINGLKVGLVDQIIPVTSKNGKISFVVRISVDDEYSFSKNSAVEIFEPSLMGGKQLKINLVYDNQIAKDGDTLGGKFQLSAINAMASEMGPKVSSVLTKVDSTLSSTNKILDEQNRREIKQLLTNLNATVSAFKTTADQTNRLLASNEHKINSLLDNANQTMVSTKNTVDKFGKVADEIDAKKLNQSIEELSKTANQLNQVIAGINRGEGSLGKLMKDEELYNNLTKTSNSLNELISDLKQNPKKYINISVFGKK